MGRFFYMVSIGMSAGAATVFYCCSPLTPIPYEPQITFAGYFNGEYDSLAGNRFWPNRCELIGDTVRIYCYSTFFSESGKLRHGDLLRIDLLPDSGNGFEKRNTLFHLARYYDRNESYTVSKRDTIDLTIQFRASIDAFSRSVGADIALRDIYVATPPVKHGRYMVITGGRLCGRVYRQ